MDPVRFRRTGQLYERAFIYQWLESGSPNPLDPGSNIPATKEDYVDAPVARASAGEAGAWLGLEVAEYYD